MGDGGEHDPYVPREQRDKILKAERELIGVEPDALNALAISGGGIRSASFALGIMQALVSGGVMKHIHYLSTVSGGGFVGASLTWFLKRGLPQGPAGTEVDNFPFGTRGSSRLDRGAGRNRILDYIRQHANYLVPTPGIDVLSLVAVVLRAMLVSLFVYFCLLTIAMFVLWTIRFFDDSIPRALGLSSIPNLALLAALSGVGAFVALSFVYSVLTRLALRGNTYAARTAAQKGFGRLLQISAILALLGTLPLISELIALTYMAVTGGLSTATGAVLGFLEFRRQQRAKPGADGDGNLAPLRAQLGAFLLLYGLAIGAFAIAQLSMSRGSALAGMVLMGLIALCGVIGLAVNLNYLGLHRMYRDRLMELFMPNHETVADGHWAQASDADDACIDQMCRDDDGGFVAPYHIVNTNVVLVDSPNSPYRGRGGDSFILSPLYCGSEATGWCESGYYMRHQKKRKPPTGRGMTLSTAMAISGAALNPNTGVGGRGLTRSRVVSTLMAVLSLRLGYWAPNPKHNRFWMHWLNYPNFLNPGLRGGVLSGDLREDRQLVELSDGGHFENLAVYELIRRRVKFIIISDGGADPMFRFEDLGNLAERVRVDFGAKISFDDPGYDLASLQKGSADTQSKTQRDQYDLAKRGFAIGSVRYLGDPRDQPSGRIIYFKTTMIAGLSPDIYAYKSVNRAFPDESTGDQFFDEAQFEAYRELGYHLGWQWLDDNRQAQWWKPPMSSSAPAASARNDRAQRGSVGGASGGSVGTTAVSGDGSSEAQDA